MKKTFINFIGVWKIQKQRFIKFRTWSKYRQKCMDCQVIMVIHQIFLTLFQNPIVSVVDDCTSSLDLSIISIASSPDSSVVAFLG